MVTFLKPTTINHRRYLFCERRCRDTDMLKEAQQHSQMLPSYRQWKLRLRHL